MITENRTAEAGSNPIKLLHSEETCYLFPHSQFILDPRGTVVGDNYRFASFPICIDIFYDKIYDPLTTFDNSCTFDFGQCQWSGPFIDKLST